MSPNLTEGLATIDSIRQFLPDMPTATTRDRGWSGITLDLHGRSPNYASKMPARDHHLICYCTSGRGRLIQRRAGIVHDSIISEGMSIIAPAEYSSQWDGDAAPSARLRVPLALMQNAASEISKQDGGSVEIRSTFQTKDREMEQIVVLMIREMERVSHPAQALIMEALSCAFVAHLLRNYSAGDQIKVAEGTSLGHKLLTKITDYIEDTIEGPICLTDLAAIAEVSRFHFARTFKRSTGLTPMAYVERVRLQRAQNLLVRGQLPLAEIALAVGFADQSHFTRRFHQHVGSTPGAFQREHGSRRVQRVRP